jgi:hypothetical protein
MGILSLENVLEIIEPKTRILEAPHATFVEATDVLPCEVKPFPRSKHCALESRNAHLEWALRISRVKVAVGTSPKEAPRFIFTASNANDSGATVSCDRHCEFHFFSDE